jgi:hypothetical protein
MRVQISLLGLLLFSGGTQALAAPAPLDRPTVISESGQYILTGDIDTLTPPALVIDAPQVSLDLNGHTVSTPGYVSGPLITMTEAGRHLSVTNGTLAGGTLCLDIPAAMTDIHIDHILCRDSWDGIAILDASSFVMSSSEIAAHKKAMTVAGSFSLLLRGNNVHQVLIQANESTCGVSFSGIAESTIEDNVFECEAYNGGAFSLSGDGGVVTGNTFLGTDSQSGVAVHSGQYSITANSFVGYRLGAVLLESSGNVLAHNHFTGGYGVETAVVVGGTNNLINENLIENYTYGMVVDGSGNRIQHNVIAGSWDRGMSVSGSRNRVFWNDIQSRYAHFSTGLRFDTTSTHNIFKGNILTINPGGGLEDLGTKNVNAGGNVLGPAPSSRSTVVDR